MRKKVTVTAQPAPPASGGEPKPAAPAAPAKPAPKPRPPSEAEIQLRAYLKWEAAGRPGGDGVNFRLAAEPELHLGDWPDLTKMCPPER
jgi:hypothetical protein